MKILVIGGGGREHAIVKKIKQNKNVSEIYAAQGNGGIERDAICVDIKPTDIKGITDFANNTKIDYVIVTPDNPLVYGLVDALEEIKIPCFGPNKKAAIIEGSKIFAKNLMKKYNIPTAKYETFESSKKAIEYLQTAIVPTVIKADGLALGKGVIVAYTKEEAIESIKNIMEDKVFGKSGERIVIEEFLEGAEVSVLSFTDGKTIIPMISSMDHKRIGDGDTGLNTGGMGTIAPNPYYSKEIERECFDKIFIPTISAMNEEGRTFKGCLYFGLMLTKNGPKVIEYNCRFGDPETQVVLPLLKNDLLDIMIATTNGDLDKVKVEFEKKSAACIIMASEGYPSAYKKGFEINIPENILERVYFAGVKKENEKLLTDGGRVLGITNVADNLEEAIELSYKDVNRISFEGAYYRKDIGTKALTEIKKLKK